MLRCDCSAYRLAKLQEARDKLQQDLSRQLANSEAKVASLQTAVQKGEERAASLELQLNAKATPASGQMLQLTLPYYTLPDHALLHLTPHLTSPHLTSPHLTSPHLISPYLHEEHPASVQHFLHVRIALHPAQTLLV